MPVVRFFERDASEVARDLLGYKLVRFLNGRRLVGKIVETEAYYAEEDPASRARNGKKLYNAPMFDGAGRFFVYNVHRYWMLNFTTKPVSAVLVRSVEPLNFESNTKGPGLLTIAFHIDKTLNTKPVGKSSGVWIEKSDAPEKIARSHRIGVTEDLETPLRFFDPQSKWVSSHRRYAIVE